MDARTQKSELTRAMIVGAALDLASAEGLESITLQAVADRIGLSKSGVFSRVGSREALQIAVIEEFGRRFIADVFLPAMQLPKGLPRLDEIVRALADLLLDPELRARMERLGLQRAAHFSWQKTAQRTLDVFHDVLDKSRAASPVYSHTIAR